MDEGEKSVEEIKNIKIEEIVEEKIERKIKQKDREIEELRKEIQKLKQKNIQNSKSKTNEKISRRGFLKKLGLGAVGLGAASMIPSASANFQKLTTQKWAKSNFNQYTNTQAANAAPIQTINGQTGTVNLDHNDIGAKPDSYTAPVQNVNGKTGDVNIDTSGGSLKTSSFSESRGVNDVDDYVIFDRTVGPGILENLVISVNTNSDGGAWGVKSTVELYWESGGSTTLSESAYYQSQAGSFTQGGLHFDKTVKRIKCTVSGLGDDDSDAHDYASYSGGFNANIIYV